MGEKAPPPDISAPTPPAGNADVSHICGRITGAEAQWAAITMRIFCRRAAAREAIARASDPGKEMLKTADDISCDGD